MLESEKLTSGRQYYMRTRNAVEALTLLPKGSWLPVEKQLLQGLAKREKLNDYLGALKCVSVKDTNFGVNLPKVVLQEPCILLHV